MWSWKQQALIGHAKSNAFDLLVMERGFLQPRNKWVSLTWNGFNGRGEFPKALDNGERWDRHFGHLLQPWKKTAGKRALLIGQVPGDASLHGIDIIDWLDQTAVELVGLGFTVNFRPHPSAPIPTPLHTVYQKNTLAEDFEYCDFVVTFSSTTAVEAIIAGKPAVVMDDGSVAAPMASRSLSEPLVYPDRTKWCHDLAWRQWRLSELADGSAWKHAITYFS